MTNKKIDEKHAETPDVAVVEVEQRTLARDAAHMGKRFEADYDEARNDGDPDKTVGGELIP